MLNPYLQVAIGGAIGSAARFGTYRLASPWHGPGFPVGTVIVNVAGSFVMGLLAVLFALRGGSQIAPFLLTGVLGGFTTFSAFSLDALTLWDRGQILGAGLYIVGSVVLSLAAIVIGAAAGRAVFS